MAKNKENLIYCKDAISLKTSLEQGFIKLGEYLYNIKKKALYEPNWTSWEEYREELHMSENSVNKLVQIYSKLILAYNVSPDKIVNAGGPSVIADLLPILNSKEQAEEWLEKASLLTRKDLRDEIKEEKTGVPMQLCKHKNTYTITVCRGCGIRMEEHKDHA